MGKHLIKQEEQNIMKVTVDFYDDNSEARVDFLCFVDCQLFTNGKKFLRFQVHVDQIFIWLRLLAKERVFKSVHFFLALTYGDVSSFFLRIFNSKHKFFKNFLYGFFNPPF
jgi:hypothetical protein